MKGRAMRYPDDHKQETRQRVVRAAARSLRRQGPDKLAVAGVMAEVGLTHGGFYAHFASKEALLGAAVEEAFRQGRKRFALTTGDADDRAALEAYVDMYVSASHRDGRELGCPITALAGDMARQAGPAREAFDAGIKSLVDGLASRLPGGDTALAGSLMAEMAGAVSLSRAVADPALSDSLLEQSRVAIKARIAAVFESSAR
jgi:TetR/AcrR family transcriptional repressor of nem operon